MDQPRVNIVLLGYELGAEATQVDPARLLAGLPAVSAHPVIQNLAHFLLRWSDTVELWDTRLHTPDSAFEDEFFDHLLTTGQTVPRTESQRRYNQEPSREATIGDSLAIDAPRVERWLQDHLATDLGIDPRDNTVVLVNWFGRDDFRFHHYTKTGEPDPDSGSDYGTPGHPAEALVAWGGTSGYDATDGTGQGSRLWFHDLSAGPDLPTRGWDLTSADVDGDDVPDHRLPPVWEYGSDDDVRPYDDLTADLTKVVRYVAFDMLFGASPLYKPALSPPAVPDSVGIDINHVRPRGGAATPISPGRIGEALQRLVPWFEVRVGVRDQAYTPRLQEIVACFAAIWGDDPYRSSCYGGRGASDRNDPYEYAWYAGSDLFFWAYDNIRMLTSATEADYHTPVLWFDLAEDPGIQLAGLADSRLLDREYSQFASYVVTTSDQVARWGGATGITTHEVGHHLSLMHPHDGFDYEQARGVSPTGDYYFTWVGGESSTSMNYLNNEFDFSQFNLDSIGRWTAAMFLNQANQVLVDIYESPRAGQVEEEVVAADQLAGAVVSFYFDGRFQDAGLHAEMVYRRLVAAAASLNIAIEPQAEAGDVRSQSPQEYFVDPTSFESLVVDPVDAATLAGDVGTFSYRVPLPRG